MGGTGGGTRAVSLTVGTPATVQGVVLEIDLDLVNVDPALLRVTLFAPSGNFYTLHEYADNFAGSYTLPPGTFQGEDAAGDWLLVIDWDDTSGERATLNSWTLKIEGASTHAVTGRIVRAGTLTSEEGVAIRIEGAVTSLSTDSLADGTFTFPELTENDYTLILTKPGFQPATVTFFLGEEDLDLGDIVLTPLTVTVPEIRGAPLLGYEPLYVEWQMLVPVDYGAAQISWNYGDGSAVEAGAFADLVAPSHIYTTAGVFTPSATLSGGSLGSPVMVTGPDVHVHRRLADDSPGAPTHQVVGAVLIGSMAARMDAGANTPAADPVALLNYQTTFTDEFGTIDIDSATIYQESQWDSASFDLDRIPFGTGNWAVTSGLEDSDYGRAGDLASGGQTFVFYNTSATDNQMTPHDEKWDARAWSQAPLPPLPAGPLFQSPSTFAAYTPANPNRPDRHRMKVTHGGYLLGSEALPMGDVNLFPGRTLR